MSETETKQTFTAGPWEVWEGHSEVFAGPAKENNAGCIRGYRRLICEIADAGDLLSDEYDPEAAEAETEANARLIAAAPDLMTACEAFIAFEDDGDLSDYLRQANSISNAIRAAVAKAKGLESEAPHAS